MFSSKYRFDTSLNATRAIYNPFQTSCAILYGSYVAGENESKMFAIGQISELDKYPLRILTKYNYKLKLESQDELDLVDALWGQLTNPIVVDETAMGLMNLRDEFQIMSIEETDVGGEDEFTDLYALKWQAKQSNRAVGGVVSLQLKEEFVQPVFVDTPYFRRFRTPEEGTKCEHCGQDVKDLCYNAACGAGHFYHFRCLLECVQFGRSRCKQCRGPFLYENGLLQSYACLKQITRYVRFIQKPLQVLSCKCRQCGALIVQLWSSQACCPICFGTVPQSQGAIFADLGEVSEFLAESKQPGWASSPRGAEWAGLLRRKLGMLMAKPAIMAGDYMREETTQKQIEEEFDLGYFDDQAGCSPLLKEPALFPWAGGRPQSGSKPLVFQKTPVDQSTYNTFMTEMGPQSVHRAPKRLKPVKMVLKKRRATEEGEPSETYSEPEEGWDAKYNKGEREPETQEEFERRCIEENQDDLGFLFHGQKKTSKKKHTKRQ